MIQKIIQTFLTKYKSQPLLVRAPGRINLIGEHTDYNKGWVMPAAIDKAMYFALRKSTDSKAAVDIHALNLNETVKFDLTTNSLGDLPNWARYLKATVLILQEKGYSIGQVQGIFGGDIPIGAGLSSSAALCCGFIFSLSELHGWAIPRKEIALMAQAAEHRNGLNCGLMDQYAVLFGKKDHVLYLDCRSLEFEYIPLVLKKYDLALINSKISHELSAEIGYNERRLLCERTVRLLRRDFPHLQSYRDVDRIILQTIKKFITRDEYRKLEYVLKENARVHEMVRALKADDIKWAGRLMTETHKGLQQAYQVTIPEIDLLVDLALRHRTVIGTRMVGGGFGGCTLNLVKKDVKEKILKRIKRAYYRQTKIEADIIEVKTADGISRIQ